MSIAANHIEYDNAYQFNHYIASEIAKITSPLKLIGIKLFGYGKIFNDNTFLRVSDDITWNKIFFENHFYNDVDLFGLEQIPLEGIYYKLLCGQPTSAHYQLLFDHGIWNAFVIYKRTTDYCNMWFFGASSNNNSIVDFYLNNIEVLKEFILYFHSRAYNIINSNDRKRLIKIVNASKSIANHINDPIDSFEEQIKFSHLKIKDGLSFTKREIECSVLLMQGKTSKEIGKILNLSPRTIEVYINNIRIKLNCRNKRTIFNVTDGKLTDSALSKLISLL